MNLKEKKEIAILLDDCFDTLNWITETDSWQEIKEGSSAKYVMKMIKAYRKTLTKKVRVDCETCEGSGEIQFSCCGIDIKNNDIKNCPRCMENCGDELEECDVCNGSKKVTEIKMI